MFSRLTSCRTSGTAGSGRKSIIAVASLALVATVSLAPAANANPAVPADVVVGDATTSPDGDISLGIGVNTDNHLVYSVVKDGVTLVTESTLGLKLVGGETLGDDVTITDVSASVTESETWETYVGTDKEILNHYNERTYTVADGAYTFDVIARAYDDGVAFRYNVPVQAGLETLEILDEATSFDLAGNPDAWWTQQNFDDDEALWKQTSFANMGHSNAPATFRWANGDHLSLHEAHLDDYAAMTLKKASGSSLQVELVPSITRDAAVVREGDGRDAPTPWRTFTIADSAAGLVESHLIENLNPAPDPVLFADAEDWVKGATYIGIWWMLQQDVANWQDLDPARHGANMTRVKEYIDFAADNGIQGVLAEGWNKGWDGHWGDQDFDALAGDLDDSIFTYAEDKGVEFVAHNETGANPWYYEDQILGLNPVNDDFPDTGGVKLFEQYQDWGINYIKTGYVGTTPNVPSREDYETNGFDLDNFTPKHHRYDQAMVNHFRFVLEEAAKYQINVNCHECVHGTGEIRTFPNAISREAVRGGEWEAFSADGNPPEHQLIIPFTRGLSGPIDYTPGIMNVEFNNRNQGSWRVHSTAAKQLAMAVNYFSGVQMAADMIEHYSINRGIEYYDGLPAQWDESRVLAAEIGDHLVTARRSGDQWWLGAMNAEEPRRLVYDLDFLGAGEWVAEIFGEAVETDYELAPSELDVTQVRVTAADTMVASLLKSSGQAIRFRPTTAADADIERYATPEVQVVGLDGPSQAQQGDIVTVTATLANPGSLPVRETATATVNGRTTSSQSVSLAASATTTAQFQVRVVGNDPVRVQVGSTSHNISIVETVPVPQNVRVVGSTTDEVTLGWEEVPGAQYELYRRADAGQYSSIPLAVIPEGTTTYADSIRPNGNNYVVRAVVNGVRSAASVEVSQLGVLVGSFVDPVGDDNGPGSYKYPTNGVYKAGAFDLKGMRVYDAGSRWNIVTSINGEVENPWGCDTICFQHVEIYVGNGSSSSVPARGGTNMNTAGGWDHAIVLDGRFESAGVYDTDNAKIGEVTLTGSGTFGEFVAGVDKSDLNVDLTSDTALGVGMFINVETDDAINNIRPVLDWDDPGNSQGWESEWRPGGGLGHMDNSPAHDSDTRDSNALDIFVGAGQEQSELMDWNIHQPVTLPMVNFDEPEATQTAELVAYGNYTTLPAGGQAATGQGVRALGAQSERVSGVPVTFTLDGPATFLSGSRVAVVSTDSAGNAALPSVVAANTAGDVQVTATAANVTARLAGIRVQAAGSVNPGDGSVRVAAPVVSKAKQVFRAKPKKRVSVTASVSGVTSGTVTFRSVGKGDVLGTAPVTKVGNAYTATLQLKAKQAVGKYGRITASVTAGGKTVMSAQSARGLRVVKARPKKVTVRTKRVKAGARVKVRVKVAKLNNGRHANGRVQVRVGKKVVGKVRIKPKAKGNKTVAVKLSSAQRAGSSVKVRARFVGKSKKNFKNRQSKITTIRIAR